jgi:2-(1,2-epoxy-1,2-dihydrophenyl)acetyl-CoA isomerase
MLNRSMSPVLEVVGRIAANSGKALPMTKRLLREAQQTWLDTLLEMSADFHALAHHTAEHEAALDVSFALWYATSLPV